MKRKTSKFIIRSAYMNYSCQAYLYKICVIIIDILTNKMSSSKPILRGSSRFTEGEKRRVIDESSRRRRHKKLMESLETDNFHDDPHADLVMSKKIPKFDDNLESRTRSKRKERNAEYYQLKYRKTFQQLIEEDRKDAEENNRMSYADIAAPKSAYPPQYFCAVCGFYSNYICVACGARICNVRCMDTHYDTRCLKWTG